MNDTSKLFTETGDFDYLIFAIAHLEHSHPDVFVETDRALSGVKAHIEALSEKLECYAVGGVDERRDCGSCVEVVTAKASCENLLRKLQEEKQP